MMQVSIRSADKSDIKELVEIEKSSFVPSDGPLSSKSFRYHIERSNILFIASVSINDKYVAAGYALVLPRKNSMRLYSIAVNPVYRGKGVARELLKQVIQCAAKRKVASVYLEVRPDNVAAILLYKKFGFCKTAELRDFYGEGSHGIRMIAYL